MKNSIKSISLIASFSLLLIVGSCISEDVGSRSPEMERQEINMAIESWEAEGLNVDTTAMGSYYVIFKEGQGRYPVAGDSVSVLYEGYLLDGQIFDASYVLHTDSIWKFEYMDFPLIVGFDEAISIMQKGTKMDIIIPSDLAYGDGTYAPPVIGAYRPLLFSMELRNLEPEVID